MGRAVENEVTLRARAKEVRALIIEKHDIENAVEIIRKHEDILTFDFGRNKYLSLLPTIRLEKGLKDRYYYLEKVIQTAVQIYAKNKNYEEMVFFAAASCDIDNLRRCMDLILKEDFSKTREGDSILLFFVKFANLENVKYLETLKLLVNEYKLPVNQADYKDHTPIIILLSKYDSLQSKNISRYSEIILEAVSIILNRNNVDVSSHRINGKNAVEIVETYKLQNILEDLKIKHRHVNRYKSEQEDEESVLFSLLAQKKESEFLENVKKRRKQGDNIFDIEDGNNTLLQLSCEKNLKGVVTYLIKEGADLSKTTKRNHKPPLEIAARRNFYSIFKELLNANSLKIDRKLFTVFLLNRGRQIKTKYFDEILCYDGLEVDIAYENGNTPLHYAIIFDNTEAMLKLLKRGASLLAKNEYGKTPLDYISKEDLELYLDRCILLDNHNKPHNKKYEIRFDFNGLLQTSPSEQHDSEVEVTSKICSSDKLKCLAAHPLILAFVKLKWGLTSPLYNNILKMYGSLFLYYFALVILVGHMTFLYLLTISALMFFTLQPSIDLKTKENYFSLFCHLGFTFLLYILVENNNICTCVLSCTLLYNFLPYHLYFSRYQAFVVNGIRKVTPHVIALFGLYCLSNFESFLKNSVIVFPLIIYLLIVTYAFNALVDSVKNIEHSFKSLYNKNTLDFIKFAEFVYCKLNPILKSPFIKYKFVMLSTQRKIKKDSKFYLNFYLNKNKFVHENFHFLKLDNVTIKSLHNFVIKVRNNAKM